MSDQSEAKEEIQQQQHSEREVNHEVENSNQQQHDDGKMDYYVDDNTHQQPLSCDSGKYHDGQEDECVDGDLPFSDWMIIH